MSRQRSTVGFCEKCKTQKLIDDVGWCGECTDRLEDAHRKYRPTELDEYGLPVLTAAQLEGLYMFAFKHFDSDSSDIEEFYGCGIPELMRRENERIEDKRIEDELITTGPFSYFLEQLNPS